MKIAFFLGNSTISDVDCSNAEYYNPGIGGSQLICIQVVSYLTRLQNSAQVIVLSEKEWIAPQGINSITVGSLENSISYVRKADVDYYVVDTKYLIPRIVKSNNDIRFIGWANCFMPEITWNYYSRQKNIIKIICVGEAQKNYFKGHPIYDKALVVFPPVPTSFVNNTYPIVDTSKRENFVVYAGSLLEIKGFGFLAKCWKRVLEQVPDAQLFVIGSGRLYDRDSPVGEYGLTYEPFESEIIDALSVNNVLLPSVHFLGVLGKEKYEVFGKCKVGVPNPGGETETFCITAVEMQLMGCVITTINKDGFVNSVYDKEFLYDDVNCLADSIVKALKNGHTDREKTLEYINQFSPENTSKRWLEVLLSISPIRITRVGRKWCQLRNQFNRVAYYFADIVRRLSHHLLSGINK